MKAKHNGPCADDCGRWIHEGDEIEHRSKGWAHTTCPDLAEMTGEASEACPDCHLIHAGECW